MARPEVSGRKSSAGKELAPKEPTPRLALSIPEFCEAHGISEGMFYNEKAKPGPHPARDEDRNSDTDHVRSRRQMACRARSRQLSASRESPRQARAGRLTKNGCPAGTGQPKSSAFDVAHQNSQFAVRAPVAARSRLGAARRHRLRSPLDAARLIPENPIPRRAATSLSCGALAECAAYGRC